MSSSLSSPTYAAAATDVCAPSGATAGGVAPDDETLASLAKALGHPARIRILRLLTDRRTCITRDVVDELPLAQSTVSEHLRILREAGLVQVSSDGPRSAYCVSAAGLAMLKAGVADL
jgi:ArsR family transcriptional regulator, arsenate/arsenite/antimonite-responsive transcriptional repressor